jgi:hypothetical protein
VLFPGENTFCQPSTNVFSRLTEDHQREEPEDEQEDGIVLVDGQLAARERRTIRMASLSEGSTMTGESGGPVHKNKVRYGSSLATDERLTAMLSRENTLMAVIIPRVVTMNTIWRTIWAFCKPWVLMYIGGVGLLVLGVSGFCANVELNEMHYVNVCNWGPEGDGGERHSFSFKDYRPAILNSAATLLLSFYVSSSMSTYRMAYSRCQTTRHGVERLVLTACPAEHDQEGSREVAHQRSNAGPSHAVHTRRF